jgi:hypothetical protein
MDAATADFSLAEVSRPRAQQSGWRRKATARDTADKIIAKLNLDASLEFANRR